MFGLTRRRNAAQRAAGEPRRVLRVGVVMVIVGSLGFYLALTHRLPFMSQDGRLVTAYFTEPNQVEPGVTPVRVDGISVGTVDRITAIDGGRLGRATLRITDPGLTLHRDARAALQYRTLLGANFAVNLDPGSPSAPPLDGAAIPLSHTSVQTELDDVIGIFRHHARLATRTVVDQLARSLDGPQLGQLIDASAPALTPTAPAFDALRGELPDDLSGLVRNASATVHTLAADRSALATLISGGAASLGAVDAERGALAAGLQAAPAALDATRAVSASIQTTLPALDRLLVALGPGARVLGPSASAARPAALELRTVLGRLTPLLASLKPAVRTLADASDPGVRVLSGLAPTLTRLNRQLLPWLASDDSSLHQPVYQLIGPTLAALDSVASEYDNGGHVIHFPAQPEANSLTFVPCTVFTQSPTPAELVRCQSLNSVLGQLLGARPTSTGARR